MTYETVAIEQAAVEDPTCEVPKEEESPSSKRSTETKDERLAKAADVKEVTETTDKVAFDPNTTRPPFTVKQLRDAIPAHCFERSAVRSLAYVFVDVVAAAALCLLANQIDSGLFGQNFYVRSVLWMAYWWWQGAVLTGWWICAHECGHRAFSEYDWLNDTVGLILHSFLLVPYHSWRISHGKHHKNTGHLHNDEVFVPVTYSTAPARLWNMPFYRSPPVLVIRSLAMLFLAWPSYLFFNLAGKDYPSDSYPLRPNHFDPSSPVFLPKQRNLIVLSDAALVAMISFLATLAWQTSFLYMVKIYLVPYFFVHMWLVLITALQHTDATVPHYADEEWTWLRGALCTVDRDYGIYNILHHHIADTHVCHHLFSKIPFYHAQEATVALRKVLGPYYRRDDTPIVVALLKTMQECSYVDDNVKIAWYKKWEF